MFSTRYLLALILLLIAKQVVAQIDSNSLVVFNMNPVCRSCGMTVVRTTTADPNHPYKNSCDWEGSLCIANGSYTLKASQISVDTVAKVLRNIQLTSNSSFTYSDCHSSFSPGSGYTELKIKIDSIPYSDSLGVLNSHGVFRGNTLFTGFVMLTYARSSWYGGCTRSDTSLDTLSLSVIPSSNLAVNQATVGVPFCLMLNGVEVIKLFSIVTKLEIYNVVGRNVATIPLTVQSFFDVSSLILPPGCYFARLSGANGLSEVVKFVVAP